MWGNQNSWTQSIVMWNGVATMENGMAVETLKTEFLILKNEN